MRYILDPNHRFDYYKKVLFIILILMLFIIIFYFLNTLTYAYFKVERINIGDPGLTPDIGVNTNIPLRNTLYKWENKGARITNVGGIVTLRTGSVPSAWKITARVGVTNPSSDITFSLFDQVKQAKFGTQVNIKSVEPFGGIAHIEDYIQLPPNTTFIFSLQATANPPAFISNSSRNILRIQQVRLDGF